MPKHRQLLPDGRYRCAFCPNVFTLDWTPEATASIACDSCSAGIEAEQDEAIERLLEYERRRAERKP